MPRRHLVSLWMTIAKQSVDEAGAVFDETFSVFLVKVSVEGGAWRCDAELVDGRGRGVGGLRIPVEGGAWRSVLDLHRSNPGKVRLRVRHGGVCPEGRLRCAEFICVAAGGDCVN